MLLLLGLPLRGFFTEVDAEISVRDLGEVLQADWLDVLLRCFLWVDFASLEKFVESEIVSFVPARVLLFW